MALITAVRRRKHRDAMRALFWIYLVGTLGLVVVYAAIGIHGS